MSLSDKRMLGTYKMKGTEKTNRTYMYHWSDVKEFIKKLKEELRRSQIVLMTDIEIAQIIDKLAGEELSK